MEGDAPRSRSRGRRIPRGFLVMLLLVVAFEAAMLVVPEYVLSHPPYEHAFMRMKSGMVDESHDYEMLVLGDCTGWASIRPRRIEEALSVSSYNLSLNADQTFLVSRILLDRYLANCRTPPRLVLIQVSPLTMVGSAGMDFMRLRKGVLPHLRMDKDILDELRPEVLADYRKHRLLTLVPSLKKQYFFLKEVPWYRTVWTASAKSYRDCMALHRAENGFFNEDLDPTRERIPEIYGIPNRYKRYPPCEFNIKELQKIIHTLGERGIPVVICTSAVRADEMVFWNESGVREKQNAVISDAFSGHDNVAAIWDLCDIANDPFLFVDYVHLCADGADLFTAEISRRLAESGLLE